jgi:hypothetical protein
MPGGGLERDFLLLPVAPDIVFSQIAGEVKRGSQVRNPDCVSAGGGASETVIKMYHPQRNSPKVSEPVEQVEEGSGIRPT